jgi:tRNA nucleotidyltransferase (CCA-adding enzyme)
VGLSEASARIPAPVREVLARLHELGHQAFLVGGCVRDMVRGASPKDYDVATSARPEEVQRAFAKTVPTGIEHGTVTVLARGHPVEVTTFRTEGPYLDARHPSTVEFRADVKDDLSRRDFTINAMALDPSGPTLVDPFGGQEDLRRRLIRCVGSPTERFTEDGLRPLRAVRFAAVLDFELDPPTEAAICAALPSFRKVAQERIRQEVTRLLLSAQPRKGLELLNRTGLLAEFLPELAEVDEGWRAHGFEVAAAAPLELGLRLSGLLHVLGRAEGSPSETSEVDPDACRRAATLAVPALQRLTFSGKVIDQVAALLGAWAVDPSTPHSDADLRRLLSRLGPERAQELLTLLALDRGASLPERAQQIRALLARAQALAAQRPPLKVKDLALAGAELMRVLGVGPSPIVGEAGRYLLEQVLERPEDNTPAALENLLRAWHESRG